jgi:hypothetical protein
VSIDHARSALAQLIHRLPRHAQLFRELRYRHASVERSNHSIRVSLMRNRDPLSRCKHFGDLSHDNRMFTASLSPAHQ